MANWPIIRSLRVHMQITYNVSHIHTPSLSNTAEDFVNTAVKVLSESAFIHNKDSIMCHIDMHKYGLIPTHY